MMALAVGKFFVFLIYMVVPVAVAVVCGKLASAFNAHSFLVGQFDYSFTWWYYLSTGAMVVSAAHVVIAALFLTCKRHISALLVSGALMLCVIQVGAVVVFGHIVVKEKAWQCRMTSHVEMLNIDWTDELFFRIISSKVVCSLVSTFKGWLLFFGAYWWCICAIHCCIISNILRSKEIHATSAQETGDRTNARYEHSEDSATNISLAAEARHPLNDTHVADTMQYRCENGSTERMQNILKNQKKIVAGAMEGYIPNNTSNSNMENYPRYALYPNIYGGVGYASVPTQEPHGAGQNVIYNAYPPHGPAPGNNFSNFSNV